MKKLTLLAIMMLATAGCSMEASLENITSEIAYIFKGAKTTGLVSGSTQSATTTSGTYKVQSSVGSYISGAQQSTVGGNYKVYSSVQGAIVSPQ